MPGTLPQTAVQWAEFDASGRVGLRFECGTYAQFNGLNVLTVRAALRQLDETGRAFVRAAVANPGARVVRAA